MPDTLQFWLTAFTSLVFIVNPPGSVPAFLALTEGTSRARKRAIVTATSMWCAAILLAFAVFGTAILRFYGVSLNAFRTAGGLILILVAVDMLRARRSIHGTMEESASIAGLARRDRRRSPADLSLTPLATPLLAGPGAISTVMVLMGQTTNVLQTVPVFLSIAFTAAATYAVLRAAEPMHRLLGETGSRALTRLMGLLIAAQGAQFMLTGLAEAGFTPRGAA